MSVSKRMMINVGMTITGDNREDLVKELKPVVDALASNGWNIIVEEKKMPYDPENNICFTGCVATKG